MRCRQEERGERVGREEKWEMGGETSSMEERRGEEREVEGRAEERRDAKRRGE